ncbi:hypothetical protein ACF3N0_00285 [Moraxella atlantae]|uniref:hypothetical protein n=1 Tax=Faucicola atlantae TaxID=34059 RepID=UPI0037519036
MALPKKLHNLFDTDESFIPISVIYKITKNMSLILNIADEYGFRPVYKNRSNKILGFGTIIHRDNWATSNNLDTYGSFYD